nr:uncharacterized protein LOC128705693 [Cherax quadricarinatus]
MMTMSNKRLWCMRSRARVHLRPSTVLATCCLLASVCILLNSVLMIDRTSSKIPVQIINMDEDDFQPEGHPSPTHHHHSLPKTQHSPENDHLLPKNHHSQSPNHHQFPAPSSNWLTSQPPTSSWLISPGRSRRPQHKSGHKILSHGKNIAEHNSENKNVYPVDAHKSGVSNKSLKQMKSVYTDKAYINNKISGMENKFDNSLKAGKSKPSAGFTGKPSSPGSGWLDIVRSVVRGEKNVNPGMLLGAVAALKTLHTASDSQNSPLSSVMSAAQALQRVVFPQPQEVEGGLPETQGFLKSKFRSIEEKHNTNTESRSPLEGKQMDISVLNPRVDSNLRKNIHSNVSNMPSKHRNSSPGKFRSVVGSVVSLLGQGTADKHGSQSLAESFINNLAFPLLAEALSSNNNKADTSSPLHSLMNGIGPALLTGMIQQGFGGGGNSDLRNSFNSATSSPLQSLISKMGPSILAGAVQNGLSAMQGDKKRETGLSNSSPVQSILSGIGSALVAGLTQDKSIKSLRSKTNKDSPTSNPVQSIIFGLAPALVAGAFKYGLSNDKTKSSPTASKSSVSQPVMNNLRSAISPTLVEERPGSGVQSRNQRLPRDAVTGGVHNVPVGVKIRNGRTLQVDNNERERKSQDFRVILEDEDNAAETSNDNNVSARINTPGESDTKINKVQETQGGLVRLLAKTVVGNLLPEELPVPELNSTRGAWDMAVNLAFGNPKDTKGRTSQFWEWLREYGGSGGATPTPAPWLNQALHNPQRAAHTLEIARVYEMMEVRESTCTNVKLVGGVFNWKKNVLDGSRAVCMDADVAPRKDSCIVYSFAMQTKWSFEEDMERMGCKVWAFDPSVSNGSESSVSNLHLYSVGLAATNTSKLVQGQEWHLLPFSSVLEQMGHQTTTIDYLKLDIQGDEWEVSEIKEVQLGELSTKN